VELGAIGAGDTAAGCRLTIAWPAAVSHSQVRPVRGYASTSHEATNPNLSEDPAVKRDATDLAPSKTPQEAGSWWERLVTTARPSGDGRRHSIRRRCPSLSRKEPNESEPAYRRPVPAHRSARVPVAAVAPQRDVDRELAAAPDEFARAVQRIDQPEKISDRRRFGLGRRLLRERSESPASARTGRDDDPLGLQISVRHRERSALCRTSKSVT